MSATGVIRGANGSGPEPLVDAGITIAAGEEQAAADYCDQLLDADDDGVRQDLDSCPTVPNLGVDADGDGVDDACDTLIDSDGDGVADDVDACPGVADSGVDADGDGIDDACDPLIDSDNDGVADDVDSCPGVADSGVDTDGDGIDDACDPTPTGDTDADGVDNAVDNCPDVANAGQEDADDDGIGDACDNAASVTGQVLNAAGEPIVGAEICIDGTDQCTTSAAGGFYAIGGVFNGDYTVTVSAFGYVSESAPVSIVNGVNAGPSFSLVPVGASVAGQVFDDAGNPLVGATICVDGTDLCTTSVDGGYYAIGGVPNGDYTVTASAGGYTSSTLDVTVAGEDVAADFTLVAVVEAETGFVEVSKFYCPGLEGTVFGGEIADDCVVGAGVFSFYLIGDGTADFWQLEVGATGVGSIELAAGSYEVVEEGTQATTTVDVVAGETTVLTVANPGADVQPATGWVDVLKFYCPDVDEVVFNGEVVGDDCVTGAATFSFYMVGDGTDDFDQVTVWEDGYGFIELEVGTYEVVEEGTQATTTIEVVANETTFLTVTNPGEAPTPRDGTVNVSAFSCTNIEETTFVSDGFAATFASLPTFEPACDPTTATLTFYMVGDGTADYWQLDVDATGSIVLAPGTYEVVEEGTGASTFITVFAGDFINLDVQIPAGGDVVPGSSINIAKFYCDTVTETEFLSLTGAEYSDRDELAGAPDCMPGMATFTFYLVGDGTAEYAQIVVNGAGTIGLEPGLYEVVEEETQARFDLEVFDGENTVLLVNNPMPEDGEVPGGPGEDVDGDTDDGDDAADKDDKDAAEKDDAKSDVTKLPSTGSGAADGTGLMALAAAAAAALSGAGALSLRNRR